MTLDGSEFLHRFLLHVLPSGFVRIRHYGLLSNRLRQERVATCRALLNKESAPECPLAAPTVEPVVSDTEPSRTTVYPRCVKRRMFIVGDLSPNPDRSSELRAKKEEVPCLIRPGGPGARPRQAESEITSRSGTKIPRRVSKMTASPFCRGNENSPKTCQPIRIYRHHVTRFGGFFASSAPIRREMPTIESP